MLTFDVLSTFIIIIGLFSFIYINPSLVIWMLVAEVVWIGLYVSFSQSSTIYNTVTLLIYGLLLLCLATSESAVGLSLLLFNFITLGNVHGLPTTQHWIWNFNMHTTFSKL